MKKICYGLCCLLAVMFVKNVYAEDIWDASIVRGESYLVENYDSGFCVDGTYFVAFETEDGCYVTNNLPITKLEDVNVHVYTDPSTSDKHYLELSSSEINHVAGKVLPYELTYKINNPDSDARSLYLAEELAGTGEDFTLKAAYIGDKIYIESHVIGVPTSEVYEFDYDSSTRVMSLLYSTHNYDGDNGIILDICSYLFLFLVETDPNYGDEAREIMLDEDKLYFVELEDFMDDGVSRYDFSMNNFDVSIDFAMLLTDNTVAKFIQSYETHSAEAPADPDPLPATPPADPTQPTQPTEPGKQPNTGTYLPLIGVMWLAMFGMVFIYCRKTMFKKI